MSHAMSTLELRSVLSLATRYTSIELYHNATSHTAVFYAFFFLSSG